MIKTTINNIIKFLLQHKRKNRIVLFVIITAILVGWGIMYNSDSLLKVIYSNWIAPATIFIVSINIIISKIKKKKHLSAKIIKFLLYLSKYSCILYILYFSFIISLLFMLFGTMPLVIKDIIIFLLPVLSLLLIL